MCQPLHYSSILFSRCITSDFIYYRREKSKNQFFEKFLRLYPDVRAVSEGHCDCSFTVFFFTGDFILPGIFVLPGILKIPGKNPQYKLYIFYRGFSVLPGIFLTTFENLAFRELIQESYVQTLLRLNQSIFETFEKLNLLNKTSYFRLITQKYDFFGFTGDFYRGF